MSQHCILLKGLPGSGKSTWARAQITKHPDRYKRVNRDDLRAMLDNGKWSRAREKHIRLIELQIARFYLSYGFSVLIDDCNLSESAQSLWQDFARQTAVPLVVQDFTDVSLETCIARDLERQRSVGERVIRQMYRQFLVPAVTPPVVDPALPSALICDLDGTLALLNGRDPYNASTCEQDLVNAPVAALVAQCADAGDTILFTSGRSDAHREQTLRWLAQLGYHQQGARSFVLLMRKAGDNRKDAVVKQELYKQHIAGCYTVKFVLDDRSSVVELWRSLGLTCLQVAEGDF